MSIETRMPPMFDLRPRKGRTLREKLSRHGDKIKLGTIAAVIMAWPTIAPDIKPFLRALFGAAGIEVTEETDSGKKHSGPDWVRFNALENQVVELTFRVQQLERGKP